jgi:hypothetical protein
VVIAVDGAIRTPADGTRLRRVLLVAALGLAGWLLSVLFAAVATAAPDDPVTDPPVAEAPAEQSPEEPVAEEPVGEVPTEEAPVDETPVEELAAEKPQSIGFASTEAESAFVMNEVMVAPAPESTVTPEPLPVTKPSSGGGLLGGLLGAVTNLVGGVLDTTDSLLSPVIDPPGEPIVDVPELLPAPDEWSWDGGSSSGSAETVRAEPTAPVSSAVVPAAPVAPVPTAAVAVTQQHTTRFVAKAPEAPEAPAAPQPSPPAPEPTDADQAQHGSGGDRLPGKVPAAPAAPAGPTASAGHDHSGGARGLHGVLVANTTLEPGDAGFTTRSRAVNAAGRAAGLPAATPD